jgi:hypothetical protein
MTNNIKTGRLKKDQTVNELLELTTTGRRLWLLPVVLFGLLVAALYRPEERPPDTPFIYTLF